MKHHKLRYDMPPHEHLIFLTVGMAMARVQHFESLVATILCSITEPENQCITIENFDKALSEFDSQTLGQLIKLMKKRVAGEALHNKLLTVREGRNFVAHWSLRNFSELDEDKTIELVEKIEKLIVEIDDVQNLLIAELSNQDVTHISEIYIDGNSGEIRDLIDG